ncbi:hypothetical protein RDI58_005608 [Solanum bulbocastanum]|uniref:Uncharacterized protein n=1 Tax=Solanum bulbocastanum TaxID=147425 RepID=A0AAN8YMU6_SOLBU
MVSSTRSGNSASTEKRSSKDKNNNKFGSDEENTCSSKLNRDVNDFASSAFLSDLTPPASETVITEDQTPEAKLEKVLEEKSTKEVHTSRPFRTVNDAYIKKHHVPTEKDTHPRQLLCGNKLHSYQNSYYSRIPPIRLTVDLPISSPVATTTQEREAVVDAAIIPEEGVGDNVAEEQQAPEGLNASAELCSAIHNDLVPIVKNYCTNLNILPPRKDDKDYY